MVSNTQEDGQIVVSKEITMTSPPESTNGSNNYDITESSSSRISALSENEEQVKLPVQHDNDNVENKGVVAENVSSVVDNDNVNKPTHTEEEINICDTCGDLGYEKSLVICSTCKVGAEHTYCMMLQNNDPRSGWLCYDCTKDGDGMPETEETRSLKRKDESFTDKMEDRTLSQEQPRLLNTQNVSENVGVGLNIDLNVDLNADPNVDMNEEPRSKKRKTEFIDFFKMSEEASSSQANLLTTESRCKVVGLDLGLNLNTGPKIDLNVDPKIDLSVDPKI